MRTNQELIAQRQQRKITPDRILPAFMGFMATAILLFGITGISYVGFAFLIYGAYKKTTF